MMRMPGFPPVLSSMLLAAVLLSTWAAPPALAQSPMVGVMKAVRADEWGTARARAARIGPAAEAVVAWRWLRAGQGALPDYAAFLAANGDWPGLELVRDRGASAIRADAAPADVIAYFAGHPPQTPEGAIRLAAALDRSGAAQEAAAVAVRAWRTMTLTQLEESTLLASYGRALAAHHSDRLEDLLWRGRLGEADRMRNRVPPGMRALLDATVALRRDAPGVDALIAQVPEDLAGAPVLAHARVEWRARRDRTDGVLALMLERSASAAMLGRPQAWARRRQVMARNLMREGRAREAYLMAAQHHLSEGSAFADLEWLAGYIALRQLDAAPAALDHFRRFRQAVASPISLGRAGYWEGRAHEAMGQRAAASAAYAFGAEFQTSFYGQLAAERAGLPMDPAMAGTEAFAPGDGPRFEQSSVYQAGRLLLDAGEPTLAAQFLSHLATSLSRSEAGRMAAAIERLEGSNYVRLKIAKAVAARGETIHAAYFPLMSIPVDGRPGVAPELALAIARRESEFNAAAVSPAGARGLMQVMPGTASDMARATGLPFSATRLTSDPGYNARLGTAYLSRLRGEFGEATILLAAAYNAGPGRPRRWVTEFGDPREAGVDAVDWIERIPFTETRNYVMRVTEALAPYRARLSGQAVPIGLAATIEAR